MKIRIILTVAIIALANIVQAQSICNCSEALDKLVNKIEAEYPGFEEKTRDKVLYDGFKRQLSEQAGNSANTTCFEVLKKFTSFFRDGHIWIYPATATSAKGTGNTKMAGIDIEKFKMGLEATKAPLEGVWKNSFEWTGGAGYEIGVTKDSNGIQIGFVISSTSAFWKPNETKFRLYPDGRYEFYTFDKQLKTGSYEIYKDAIVYFRDARATFVKEVPHSDLTTQQIMRKVGELYGFGLKKISGKTALLTLPSFDYPFVELIGDLMASNRSIMTSKNLIIDIRGNSGGTDNAYEMLFPYIITNPIRNMGVEYLATQTLVNGLEGYIKTVRNTKGKQGEIDTVRRWIGLYEKNMGKFVNLKDSSFSIQTVAPLKRSPKQVVILTDKRVGSAAESFVMKVKQSKKVKVFGTVTSGGLDYAAARMFDFGCPEFLLQLPTYRSLRLPDYPIDNIGMQPDIYLDKSTGDWVKFALDYLEHKR